MTVAELSAAEYQEVGFVLAVEGWPIMWTNRADLAGSGGGSWIGTGEGARTVAIGLEVPSSLRLAIEGIDESGMLGDDGASFTLVDCDGHLIDYAEAETGSAVFERVAPTDDPAPASLIGGGGESVTLHGRWLNGEAIGSAGQRRLYQCIPGSPFAPRDHAAVSDETGDLRPSVVHTAARFYEGALCALYVIRRDPVTGTWASWSDQNTSGYARIWWGRTRGLSAEGRAWTLTCDGPSSWLARTLNDSRLTTWRPARPLLDLKTGEDKIAISFTYMTSAGTKQVAGHSWYQAADTLTGETAIELASEIDTRLLDVADDAGPDTDFEAYADGKIKFTAQDVIIQVNDNGGAVAYGGLCYLRMHRKVWATLGWDLKRQVRSVFDLTSELAVEARSTPDNATDPDHPLGTGDPDPGPGYLEALFRTLPINVDPVANPARWDNDGAMRRYLPMFPGGAFQVTDDAEQRLDIGLGNYTYLEGQLARPVADVSISGVGAADETGFIALRAPYQTEDMAEARTRVALAKVSWKRTTAQTVEVDSDGRAILWLERWLDATKWGAEFGDDIGTWVAQSFEWQPVALLHITHGTTSVNAPDRASWVLLRLLLSTGTASAWTGFEGDPAPTPPTPGVNAHPDATNIADDMEIADLGLGIPAELVDFAAFDRAGDALPGGKSGVLNQTRVALLGPTDSLQLIEDILKPRGWCLSLAGGKYGIFARSAPIDVDDAVVTITQADIAGAPDELPPSETVEFSPLTPFDLVELRYNRDQLGGDGEERTLRLKARDERALTRRGGAKRDIDAWTITADAAKSQEIAALWSLQLARFYGEPYMRVRFKVKATKARDIWPGTVIRYTSPWPATRSGAYGMTASVGRVLSVERDLQTLAAEIEVLVAAGDPTTPRRFAPIARLLDDVANDTDRHNTVSRTLYCHADAFGRGEDTSDVAGFAEPAWLGVGGDALAYVWSSWDGETWEKTAEFEVESVNTSAHTITYKTGSLTGTIWERRFTVLTLAPYEDQAASSWPRSLFGVFAGYDGKFGAGNLDAFPWVG